MKEKEYPYLYIDRESSRWKLSGTRPREITVNSEGRPIGSGQTPTDLIP